MTSKRDKNISTGSASLLPLIEHERGLLSASHDIASEPTKRRLESLRPKETRHVYLFVGEPRTGKTTLARLAGISRFVHCVDTDGFSSDSVLAEARRELSAFLDDGTKLVCVIVFGLHRRQFDAFLSEAKSAVSRRDGAFLSVCRFERFTEARVI